MTTAPTRPSNTQWQSLDGERQPKNCEGSQRTLVARHVAELGQIFRDATDEPLRGKNADRVSFRDLKSHRYGVGLEDSLTRIERRLSILLLLHALACFAAWIAARTASKEIYQAASTLLVRLCRRTLVSWHQVGWKLLQQDRWRPSRCTVIPNIERLIEADVME